MVSHFGTPYGKGTPYFLLACLSGDSITLVAFSGGNLRRQVSPNGGMSNFSGTVRNTGFSKTGLSDPPSGRLPCILRKRRGILSPQNGMNPYRGVHTRLHLLRQPQQMLPYRA